MKRLLLVMAVIALFARSAYSQTESQHQFLNPEYTWKYNRVGGLNTPWNDVDFSLTPMELKIVGTEQRDGKDYCKLSWTIGEEDPEDLSYFLVREENGAWFTYIEYNENIKPSDINIAPGEYLLYDFNLEPGTTLDVPASYSFNFYGMGSNTEMGMCQLQVASNSVDEYGRRVLTLAGDRVQHNFWGYIPEEVKVVEGVGALKNGNLAMYFFPDKTTGAGFDPQVEFFEILGADSQVIYLDPCQRAAGFLDSMDYTWVYGMYDSEGVVSYLRTDFNYYNTYPNYQTGTETSYRRFRISGISDSPDGPWKYQDIPCFELREGNGKVWRLGNHLLYDFGAADGSELTFYSPAGEQTRRITTGFTEVGGEQRRSYTFDGSDGVTCVEGIGIIKGGILPVVNSDFRLPAPDEKDTYVGAALIAVYDGDGNLIFSQEMPSGVETISAADGFTAPADRLFDLEGRELSEPIPGQPYIKGGHIFLEK